MFQNFKLIYEYRLSEIYQIKLWPIPPPFNLINIPVFICKYIIKRFKKKHLSISQENNQTYEIILGKKISYKLQNKFILINLFLEKIKSYSEITLQRKDSS